MPLAALLLLACGAEPSPALSAAFASDFQLTLASDDENGSQPGWPFPHPTPMVNWPGRGDARSPATAPQSPAQRPPPPPPADAGLRALVGIGLHGGGNWANLTTTNGAPGSPSGGAVGIYLRLGVQVDNQWGAEAEIAAASVFIASYVRGALTLEYTTDDWFTFAIGPTVSQDWDLVSCGCGASLVTVESVGGTVRLDFHLWSSRSGRGRNAFTVGFVGDIGDALAAGGSCSSTVFSAPGLTEAFYLTLGYTHY